MSTTQSYIQLTEAEVQHYEQLGQQAQAGQIGYWTIYEDLAHLLTTKYGAAQQDSAVLWLRGASEANEGVGSFSALIRTYTETQYRLRYGADLPAGAMQEASNAVAISLLDDLFGRNSGWPRGQVPDINRIGLSDATAVGDVLFGAKLGHNELDTAYVRNAAWSGTLLFSLLGSDQTGRLMSTGASTEQVDSLNDWRDVLMAFESFRCGLQAAVVQYLSQGPVQQGTDAGVLVPTVVAYLKGQGRFSDVLATALHGASGTLGQAFALVDRWGAPALLDHLMGGQTGQCQLGQTTEANFAQRAHAFFASLDPSALATSARLLPTDAPSLQALALADTADGASVRAALAALSPIALALNPDVQQQFDLWDSTTGQGRITEHWVADRATAHAAFALYQQQHGSDALGGAGGVDAVLSAAWGLPLPQRGDTHIRVEGPGGQTQQLTLDGVDLGLIPAKVLHFGNDQANTLAGGAGNDGLYGGDGADTLNGGAGSDWLEGGQGFDRYEFASRDGQDTVVDVDGQGCIVVDGQVLAGGQQLAQGVWCSEDGRWTYRLGEQGDLQISDAQAGADGVITVKGWAALAGGAGGAAGGGQALGIRLDDGERPTPATVWTFRGDQHAPIEVGSDGIPRYAWSQVQFLADGTLQGGVKEAGFSDVLWGAEGNQRVEGLGGNDLLGGGEGDDVIDGGIGDDLIAGGRGADVLYGGAGNDWIFTDGDITSWLPVDASLQWQAPAGAEVITSGLRWGVYRPAGAPNNLVDGVMKTDSPGSDPGIDLVDGGAGDDHIVGGMARDQLHGGTGADRLWGAGGDDWLFGEGGGDTLYGDGHADHMGLLEWTPSELHGSDFLDGGAGNDDLYGQGGADVLLGGDGNDLLSGDWTRDGAVDPARHGNDFLDGGAGNDDLRGDGGDDTLLGGAGDDNLQGDRGKPTARDGADLLDGGDGNDVLVGNGGDDILWGGDGNDVLIGDHESASAFDGRDHLDGGAGDDTLEGGGQDDTLLGGAGDDELSGDDGNDVLSGGDGNDRLYGNAGDDQLEAGSGTDLLSGGAGNDTYILLRGAAGEAASHARIVDFKGSNTLVLDAPWSAIQVRPVLAHEGSASEPGQPEGLMPGSLKVTVGQRTVWIDGGLGGSISTVQSSEGAMDMQHFLQQSLQESLALESSLEGLQQLALAYGATTLGELPPGAGRTLWGAAGDDTLTARVGGTVMRGGLGRDQLVMAADGNTVQMAAGDGQDVLVFQGGGHHTVALDDGLSLDDAQLRLNDQGQVVLDLGASASLLLLGQEPGRLTQSGLVSELVQGDRSVGWWALLERGVRFDGMDRNDVVMGTNANDRLTGGGGDDLLLGGDGDDVLDGGSGTNLLAGGRGDDTYCVNAVAGETLIDDADGTNTLRLGAGLSLEQAQLQSDATTGEWSLQWAGGVSVRIADGARRSIEWLESADGRRWSFDEWAAFMTSAQALQAGDQGQQLVGGAGDDHLVGGHGSDVLVGHRGNDRLEGGAGTDTIRLARGDGADTLTDSADGFRIEFGAGIGWGDLSVSRGESDGVAWMSLGYGPGDELRLVDQAAVGDFSVSLADGAVRHRRELLSELLVEDSVVQGTSAGEVLYGLAGNDRLSGGGGVDALYGGRGVDTYRMSVGGVDTVYEHDHGPNGIEVLGDPAHLRALRLGEDVQLEFRSATGDDASAAAADATMRIKGFFSDDAVWSVTWADGSSQALRPWVQQALMQQDTDTRRDAFYQRILDGKGELSEVRGSDSEGSVYSTVTRVIRDRHTSDDAALQVTSHAQYNYLPSLYLGQRLVQGVGMESITYNVQQPYSERWIGSTESGFVADDLRESESRWRIPANAALVTRSRSPLDSSGSPADTYPREPHPQDFYLVQLPQSQQVTYYRSYTYSYWASLWEHRLQVVKNVVDLSGGDGDNTIEVTTPTDGLGGHSALVSGGAGNDTIRVQYYRGEGMDGAGTQLGHFLDGGSGNDRIQGSDFMDEISGSVGRDVLAGGGGNDVYVVSADEDAVDTIYDLDRSLMQLLDIQGDPAHPWWPEMGEALSVARGLGLARGDTVRFGVGIRPQDITVSWGVAGLAEGVPAGDPLYGLYWGAQQALSIRWGTQGGLKVAYDAELADAIGFGVERYEFADGTVMTEADMLALAGPDPAQAGASSVQRDIDGATTVYSASSHTLSHTRDHVVLLGSGDINAVGNDRANVLLGNAGANLLDGDGGADIMAGGMGDDTYRVDDQGDVVAERTGQGTDRVYTTVDYALPENVEELHAASDAGLTLKTGTAGGLLVGRAGDDTLVGAWGNDTLKGGAGADTLIGDGGENLLIGGAGADRYLLGGWERNTVREAADSAGDLDVVVLTDTDIRDASFAVDGNDLMLGSYWAQNRIVGAFASSGANRVERFEFKGGDALTWAQVDAIAHQRATVYDFLPPPPEPPLPAYDPATPPWYVPPSYVEEA